MARVSQRSMNTVRLYMLNKLLILVVLVSVGTFSMSIISPAVYAANSNGSGDVVTQTVPGQTVAEKLGARAKVSWPWYIARASGLPKNAELHRWA